MRISANSILAVGLSSFAFAVLFATFAGKAIRGVYEQWEYLQDRATFWQLFASGGQQNDILGLTHNLIWLALMISMWWILWKFDIFFRPDSKEETSVEDKGIEEPEHSQKSDDEDLEEETDEPEKPSDPQEDNFASVLGLVDPYDMDDVKSAYRTLIAQYHPDKVSRMGDEIREVAERKAKEINESYDFFRRKYDL
ncbi:uncharacterized protein METZ01_LOCUS414330 [marine metagenome]|uniref:J domain-containing protein n=1 Tax=marine metagenome TaxID=408172 RepID=A0A382WRK9_9ZZZZ